MRVPPTKKMMMAQIIDFFRPRRSPNGNVVKAPKKVPAWNVETIFPCNVSLWKEETPLSPKSRLNESRASVPPITAVSYPTRKEEKSE